MAHHLGMGLVALTNVLTSEIWQRRFHADPLVRSAELLLHERIPRRLVLQEPQGPRPDEALPEAEARAARRCASSTRRTRPQPHVALLGHLPYTIMVSHCGAGYSRYEALAVTRWQSDGTRDSTGQFCYVKDLSSGRVWSAAHQPVCAPADWYNALAGHRPGHLPSRRRRRSRPAPRSRWCRRTRPKCGESPSPTTATRPARSSSPATARSCWRRPRRDRAHPAFGNLFVETEWHEWCNAITATRRPRSSKEQPLWCVHVVDGGRQRVGPVTCETDRARFLGRGRSTRDPVALDGGRRAVGDDRRGARSDLCAPHPGPAGAGPVGVGGVHHPGRHQPRPRLRAGRPLPRSPRGAAGARPGLDLEPGGAARVPSHARRCGRVPGAGRPSALRQRRAAGAAGRAPAEPRLPAAALGHGVSRRLAHPAGHDRFGGWAAHAAPAA